MIFCPPLQISQTPTTSNTEFFLNFLSKAAITIADATRGAAVAVAVVMVVVMVVMTSAALMLAAVAALMTFLNGMHYQCLLTMSGGHLIHQGTLTKVQRRP